jgi:hypothetical protein
MAITEDFFQSIRQNPARIPPDVREAVRRLAAQYRFFHWHLAFPSVFMPERGEASGETGWEGGFDVVLGNPPWERIKLQEQEFFAARSEAIATAPNAAARKKLIAALPLIDPGLWDAWCAASRGAQVQSHLVRHSGRYPLCGKGDVNTYALFAEVNRAVLGPRGCAGFIVPTGIATDDTTKDYFGALVQHQQLASFYSFENEEFVFPAVHHAYKFALLTVDGSGRAERADLQFFARQVSALADPERHFSLAPVDFAELNPNTHTCQTFRSRRDAEINKVIYRRVPVFFREGPPEDNPWGIIFISMFHMANDSSLFHTRKQLEAEGGILAGNLFERGGASYLPLYEAKMVHHFDHRFGTYEGQTEGQANQGKLPELDDDTHADPARTTLPEYWVHTGEVESRLSGRWDRGWLLGWRDICRSTDQRTVIASLIPRAAMGCPPPIRPVISRSALSSVVARYARNVIYKLNRILVSHYNIIFIELKTLI